ncbi:AGE family epimerase/isomerase [Bowmanella dokdonensis]|uniref:AGE family epimerase/isomerase n=1 Tax=Bowmanella dokdonensis TaxID=751969 RepID=A0A939DML6_9ALTE|nr:AGE family epimerase/isomerase [Bowmanella dokdonensis]MBN7825369.1 AGE family epimerase/isomerase [Bowmanella dokdonensis]
MQTYALPLWVQQGIESSSGAAFETMLMDGSADVQADRRTRVQARQMFVFAAATEMGWLQQGSALVTGIQQYLDRFARHPKQQGAYAFKLDARHQIVDARLDTYDCAFFLLAWAYQYKTQGMLDASKRADRLMLMLNSRFRGANGGWLEGDYPATRRQNPHMHLFEAFLAWYEVSGEEIWLERAGQVFSLFERHFFDAKQQVLYEYFDDQLNPLPAAQGQVVEPGHHMEWVWLLRQYQKHSDVKVDGYCQALYDKALNCGLDKQTGLLVDEMDAQGRVVKASKRLWTVTELIKAHLAQADVGLQGAEEEAASSIQALIQYHLNTQVPGFYIERLDERNRPMDQPAPATSMYHLMMACREAVLYCNQHCL